MRSFTLLAGFWLSSFATIARLDARRSTRLSRTSGVRPISSVALRAIFTDFSWVPSGWPAAAQDTPQSWLTASSTAPNSSSTSTVA